jgi:phosphoribosylglycinamide formyltransferase-1
VTARLVVLASGNGSNLQAVLDAVAEGVLDARVVAVGANRPDVGALARARRAGCPTFVVEPAPGEPRPAYGARLRRAVAEHRPDWVVLAGWMRILSATFLDAFAGRVVNLHPALPGEFPGTRAIERAFADPAVRARGHTGVMIHLVPDEGVDDGPVLATATVEVRDDDTLDSLTDRVHRAEHALLVRTLQALTREEVPHATHP